MWIRPVAIDHWKVYAIASSEDDCELLKFLESLSGDQAKSGQRLVQLLELVSQRGPRELPDAISHQIDPTERIWQFTKGDLRLLWFYDDGRLVICSHAFVKKGQKTPIKQLERAIESRKRYIHAKSTDSIEVTDDDNGKA